MTRGIDLVRYSGQLSRGRQTNPALDLNRAA